MADINKWSRKRALLAVTLPPALLAAAALAGSFSTSLPNGAELAVSIDDPVTSTEFQVPVGETAIDVEVAGTASVGLGEPDATFVYVMDVSGSTDTGFGTGCSPILDCEQEFVKALNQAVIADGSVDEVGLVVYASSAATADMSSAGGDQMIVEPNADGFVNTVVDSTFSVLGGDGGVAQFSNKIVGVQTNCTAGLTAALTVVNAATNSPPHNVVFVSDGLCDNSGGGGMPAFFAAIANLAAAEAVVTTIAAGAGSSCEDHEPGFEGTLEDIAEGTGGECFERDDPGDLPDIIPQLIGSSLDSLEIEVDGGGKQPIPDADISLLLPQDGAISVDYATTVTGLGPGDHTICVTANGSDVTGGVASVTQCETIHLLQLTATPANEVNDLNFDDQHTVTAEVFGGSGPDRDIDFVVGGQNAATATPGSGSISTAVNVPAGFVYTVPQDCVSLGLDTVTVSTVIAGDPSEIEVTKEWIDAVAPEVSCDPSVNPHGNQPNAPGGGGQGQNQDGFYQLNAEDPNLANCTVTLEVSDGDGFVFPGPFLPGDVIKYTQADGAPQKQKRIGSGNGQAGAVRWHLLGHGDLTVTGTDPSGNSSSATCLVPPPPM